METLFKLTFALRNKTTNMKNFKSVHIFTAVMMIAFFMVPVFAIAQDPGGGPDAPIDGGLSLLLAAGTAYGVKKYRDGKKKQGEKE